MAATVGLGLERTLLPTPNVISWNGGNVKQESLSLIRKVAHFVGNFFKFSLYLVCLPPALLFSGVKALVSGTAPKKELKYEALTSSVLPKHFGFADSHFQTSGLGTKHSPTKLEGVCNWDKWLNPKQIEGTKEGEYAKFFIDQLENPDPFINALKDTGATAHRFSMEWSVIEPRKGEYSEKAIGLYRNYIKKLREAGIEPYVTIHHFVCPEWFEKEGGFDKLENVEKFKDHALSMMEKFPEVTNWMPFNEINVDAFQKCVRGVYPPGREGDIDGAGKMMRNMLIAHCKIYQEAKAKWPDLQIGSTHQWLNFEPLEGNPLEKAICYFLSKITHYAVYNFFKTGHFSLEMPTKANVQFSIPSDEFKKNKGFSDFMGVQFYGYPRLKAGFNGGHDYPGYKVTNLKWGKLGLSFGSTCNEGGKMMSFGPSFYPESLEKCLDEATALNKPIVISETGCDAKIQKWGDKEFKVDNETQKNYFQRIFPILKKFQSNLKAFFTWTFVRGHLEWDRGDFPILGVQNSPAAAFLKDVYTEKKQSLKGA